MLKRALILAAGRGRPVHENADPMCLQDVGGKPLILRTLRFLHRGGIRHVGITVGWRGADVRRRVAALLEDDPSLPLDLIWFDNPDWEQPNGLSVLAASPFVTEPVLLLAADQIASPTIFREITSVPAAAGRTVLGVDRDLARVFDIDDATKVRTRNDAVVAIGKDLREHDAVSAGIFVMSPTLVDALRGLVRPSSKPSLTQGVQAAAERGLVVAHDVGGRLWQDVDSPEMKRHADWLLRVYGDDLNRPAAPASSPLAPSHAPDTLALVERLLAEKDAPGYVLLNPGPVMTSARVKAALVHHDTCHRDDDYTAVVRRLQSKLRPLFGASPDHEMLLLTGSGTAAMEMAISSVVAPGKKILIVANGAFGERLDEIARLHGIACVFLRYRWGDLPNPDDVAGALDADPDIAAAAMIHHETSVGLLNPVSAVGRVCRDRGVMLIVDAVSTLGAEDLDVVRDDVDICYSSANKCLHSVSGVSFLCVAPGVWPRIADIPPRVYYLDLLRYRRYLAELEQTPFTPAVSAFFALETAVDELMEQGGPHARREAYRWRSLRIRSVLAGLGFQSLTNTGRESPTISTLRLPDFLDVDQLYDALKARGFIIYKCKGDLAARHVQVANMGELPDATLDAFLATVADITQAARS